MSRDPPGICPAGDAAPGGRVLAGGRVFFLLFFAAAAPSPLYGVYQAQWRFSAIMLTAVFAARALRGAAVGTAQQTARRIDRHPLEAQQARIATLRDNVT